MRTEPGQEKRSLFSRWVRATTIGWLLGFVLIIILALAWDMIGGGAQFMVGVGMGAGVGYVQSRLVGKWIDKPRRWLWASVLGMGAPFLLWDLSSVVGATSLFSLPLNVLVGGLFVGILQWRLLHAHSDRAIWWVPACLVGWGLPAAAIALGDGNVFPGPWGQLLSLGAMLFGGVVLGAVTGKALSWVLGPSAAA